jgi:hypothetical protein
MSNSGSRRVSLAASVFFLSLPVAFGAIRAFTTGNDFRYLCLAGAAIAGSMVVTALRPRTDGGAFPVGGALLAVAAGTGCAFAAALLMGTTANLGLAIVAISFGLCTGTGACLALFRRARTL